MDNDQQTPLECYQEPLPLNSTTPIASVQAAERPLLIKPRYPGISKEEILEILPHKPPFLFLDELLLLNDQQAIGRYTFKPSETFYAGHFPGNPLTPGVILLEAMCQTGIVSLGLYLLAKDVPREDLRLYDTLFTDTEMEFYSSVYPGECVTIYAEKIFWRRLKLKSKVEMRRADESVVARGVVSGIGVKRA